MRRRGKGSLTNSLSSEHAADQNAGTSLIHELQRERTTLRLFTLFSLICNLALVTLFLTKEATILRPPLYSAHESKTSQTLYPLDFLGGSPEGHQRDSGAPDIRKPFYFFYKPNQHGYHYWLKILVGNGWTRAPTWRAASQLAKDGGIAPAMYFLTRAPSVWKTEFNFFVEGRHIVNHSPGDRVIFNKEPFLLHLEEHGAQHGCDYTQITPLTYRLHDPEECQKVLELEASNVTEAEEQVWFTKILEGSHGQGIYPFSIRALREKFTPETDTAVPVPPEDRPKVCSKMSRGLRKRGGLLLQRAVPPFLTQGKKFDIRLHMLIANHKPYYVYYNVNSGYLRRSLKNYDVSSNSRAGHVTNSNFQKHESNFDPKEHLWGLHTQFKDYMLSLGYSETQFRDIFEIRMKKLMLAVFHSFKTKLNRKNGYWLLLGVDVIVSPDMTLSILEVNSNPALRYDLELVGKEALARFWDMGHEALSLVYEIHRKSNNPQRKYDPLTMASAKNWHLLYTDDPLLGKPWAWSTDVCFTQEEEFTPSGR